jgi:hypothetical protein
MIKLILSIRAVAQLGSAPPWGGGGRGFKSRLPDQDKINSDKGPKPLSLSFFSLLVQNRAQY